MLTANGQQSASVLDPLAGKEIKDIHVSAYYTENETYAVVLDFTDGTSLSLKAAEIMFDQYSSDPIIKVEYIGDGNIT